MDFPNYSYKKWTLILIESTNLSHTYSIYNFWNPIYLNYLCFVRKLIKGPVLCNTYTNLFTMLKMHIVYHFINCFTNTNNTKCFLFVRMELIFEIGRVQKISATLGRSLGWFVILYLKIIVCLCSNTLF